MAWIPFGRGEDKDFVDQFYRYVGEKVKVLGVFKLTNRPVALAGYGSERTN